MPLIEGNIELYMGPSSLGAPDDLGAAVVGFIDGAREALMIAVQELEARPVAEAIVRASQRGCSIRMVIEQDYLRAKRPSSDPFNPAIDDELSENRTLLAALLRAGIDVRADYNPEIFHQKFIVRDPGRPTRGLLTGSANFTPTDVGIHPVRRNLNHVVIIHDARVAAEYADEFEEIWSGTFGRLRTRHERSPRNNRVSGVLVRAIFAPDHTPELEIMKLILKAKRRVDFAIFTFAQSSGVDDAIVAKVGDTLPVRGIFDAAQGNQRWAASRIVAPGGAEAYLAARGAGLGKLHHKLIVIDDELTVVGSFNFTDPANRLNDENILVLGNPEETNEAALAAQRRIAAYARAEIDRMIEVHGVRIVPADT